MHEKFNMDDPQPRKHDMAVLQLNASAISQNCTATFATLPKTVDPNNYANYISPISGDLGVDLMILNTNDCNDKTLYSGCKTIDSYFFCADGILNHTKLKDLDDGKDFHED